MLWRSPSLPYRPTPHIAARPRRRPTADVACCRSTALPGLGGQPDRAYERRECRGYLAPPWVLEKEVLFGVYEARRRGSRQQRRRVLQLTGSDRVACGP